MTSIMESIEVEAEELLRGRSLPTHAKPLYVAMCQHSRGLPIDQVCPYCNGVLSVEDRGAAWIFSCPCGRCKETLRGL